MYKSKLSTNIASDLIRNSSLAHPDSYREVRAKEGNVLYLMVLEKYSVYILFSVHLNSFYTGTTCDFENRLEQHNLGFYDNSYTKKANDWEKYLLIECDSKRQSLKVETHIKKMKSITYIKNLKKYPEMILKLKEKYYY